MGQHLKWLILLAATITFLFVKTNKTYAFSVQLFNTSISASTNQNVYRLRAPGKAWQLSALAADQITESPIIIGNNLLFAAKSGTNWQIYRSTSGLDYAPIANLNGDSVQLVQRDNRVFVLIQNGLSLKLFVINSDLSVDSINSSLLTTTDDKDRLFVLNGQIYFAQQSGNELRINRWQSGVWNFIASLSCPTATLREKPFIILSCSNNTLYYPSTEDSWQSLFSSSVQNINYSSTTLVANDLNDNLYVWQDNILKTYSLLLSGQTISSLKLINTRIFLKLSDNSWLEFDPLTSQLFPVPGDLANLSSAENDARLIGKIDSSYWISDGINNWQAVTTDGDLTDLRKVTGGWLAWQIGSNLTQFAGDGSLSFHKITTSWAASSKIQAVYTNNSTGFVLLLNSSNNPNLYQTSDYSSWTRISLPTTPTYSVSVNQARTLPASSLVELNGVITIPRGVVNSETLYIQDDTGGIQVFLDSGKGALPADQNKRVTITGQLSTSQTKRIILSAADDLIIGDSQTISPLATTVDELPNHLASLSRVEALISSTDSDNYLLQTASGTLKFHFPKDSLTFVKNSVVRIVLVPDYNSSTGVIEAWYVGQGAELVSTPTTQVTSTMSSTIGVKTKAVSAATKVVKANNPATAIKTSEIVTKPLVSNDTVRGKDIKVASAKTNEDGSTETPILVIGGFLAGAFLMRGQRIQSLLRI